MKTCPACKTEKKDEEFARSSRRYDGRASECRGCGSRRRQEYEEARSRRDPKWAEVRKARRVSPEKQRQYAKLRHEGRGALEVRRASAFDRSSVMTKYGVTVAELDKMLEEQEGLCAICRRKRRLDVDHDHKSGKVRAWLCRGCNVGLGQFQDSVEVLLKAVEYLKKHGLESL